MVSTDERSDRSQEPGFIGKLRRRIVASEVYRSVVRHPPPDSVRGRAMATFHNFFLHVYPTHVPRGILAFRSTFRLGFITAVTFVVLLVSGTFLMFFYVPDVPGAYLNMHEIQTQVAFGQFVRNLHRWSAHLMVVVVFLHMVRVFYAGAYKPPRQFNWVVGVILLLLTLSLSFTGYLLPWDQLAFWAVTVGTNVAAYAPIAGRGVQELLLGGSEIAGATLLRFYVLHIYVLPGLLTVLLGVHIWRVRKDGFALVDRDAPTGPTAEKEQMDG